MKKKLSRIVGVAVSIALVASLCAFAIPVATPAEAANQQWSPQTLPTATGNVMLSGSNVTDYAVANDGLTIYVANNGVAANAAGAVLVSTNGGQSFTALTVTTAAATVVSAIAVAPDDPLVVAVVEFVTTACVVHISVNGGATWTALPVAYAAPALNTSDITDIDVGPARSGCVFGREYVVSFSDPTAATIAGGDAQIIGRLATWDSISATDVSAVNDYMSVKFSPNFVGDRVVALVGANATGVYFQLVNTNTTFQVRAPVLMTPAGVAATTVDYDQTAAAASSIIAADIALPNDFDPNVVSMREAFASYGSITPFTDNDVYRIDDSSVRALAAVNLLAIKSVAYTGVIDDGALFIGEYASNNVKYALDPWVSLPYWKSTRKGPSPDATIAANAQPIVRVSPTDSNVVFAGTTSAANLESAFSVSNNKALSFDAISLIDSDATNTVVTVDDVYLTPDGVTQFMATSDTGGAQLSLWKSATPTSTTGWSRIYVATRTGAGLVRLNPNWDATPTIYFAQRSATGAIYVSTDGGDIFNTGRTAPAGVTATDIAVENSNTVYLAGAATALVYKSTNSAAIWETPVSSKAGVIRTLAMAPSYPNIPVEGNLLVGGTAAVSYSTNGGTSFNLIEVGLAGTGLLQVLADEDYATEGAAGENIIYCADSTVGNNVFRFVIGTSGFWDNLVAGVAAGNVSGLAMANGVFYALQDVALGPYRTLYSTAAVGLIPWEAMGAGAIAGTLDQAPSALRVTGGSNILYAINTTGNTVLTYTDMVATDVPTLTGPADGSLVDVDPVAGRANDIQFAWSSMESGTGLVNGYEIWIALAGTDFAAPLTLVYEAVAGVIAGSTGGLNASNPQLIVGPTGQWVQALMANTDYEWKIRARNSVSADAIRSGWSEVRSFSVQAGGVVQQAYAGPVLQGPTGGAVDVALSPGFSWSPVSGATEYEFILATDAGLTNTIADTPATLTSPAFQVTTPLEYGTVYFWAVRSTSPTVSPQGIGSFTTMEEPAAAVYTCMQCGLQFESQADLEAHIAAAHAPVTPATPAYIWGIITIGAVLVIVVIVLITRTRRVA